MPRSIFSDDPLVSIELIGDVWLDGDDLDRLQEGDVLQVPINLNTAVRIQLEETDDEPNHIADGGIEESDRYRSGGGV